MVTGFIAMRILPDQPGDIALFSSGGLRIFGKQFIELSLHVFSSADKIEVSLNIMRHIKGILPAIGLREIIVHLPWVEG